MPRCTSEITSLLLIILIMTACNGFPGPIVSSDDRITPSPWTPVNLPGDDPTQSLPEITKPPTPTISSKPPTPTTPPGGSQRFRIEQRSHTDQEAMQDLTLVLHSAELSAEELSLRIGFENTTKQAFSLIGRFEKRNVVLVDAAGQPYEPLRISENLQKISPPDGFAPGQANVGNLVFPRPVGSEPYELRLSRFDPIQFRLNDPLPDEALFQVAPGDYPLNVRLHSTTEALAPFELRVHSIQVTRDRLILSVGFINASAQANGLLVSPTGGEVRLQDAEGSRYKPIAVSETLQNALAPEEGWEPGQEHTGTLSFPLPEAISEVHVIFSLYGTLILRFDQAGVAEVRIVSDTGGGNPN